MRAHARNKTKPMPPCEPSVTSFGRSSMRCTSPTSVRAGRHQAPSNQWLPARRAIVMTPELNSRPHLALVGRLNEKGQQSRVLHMPERALRLNGPSLEIVERCDGKRTVREIISELQEIYSKDEPKKVDGDILGYLALLNDQRALDFTSDQADRSANAK